MQERTTKVKFIERTEVVIKTEYVTSEANEPLFLPWIATAKCKITNDYYLASVRTEKEAVLNLIINKDIYK
jgi:hypothetical protein